MASASSRGLSTREKWLIGAIIAIAIVAVIAIFARPAGPGAGGDAQAPAASAPSAPQAPAQAQQQPPAADGAAPTVKPSDFARRDPADRTALGEVDAPIVLIEYSDYRCPFCGLYAVETQPQIVAEYVDKGLLRIEWRDTPIFGPESELAAIAARAAGEQGRFWEYNHAVFELAERGGHTELPREKLLEIAGQVGVPDLARFEADLASPELAQLVAADRAEATSIGVSSTPTFIIGDSVFSGAYPLETFREVIEAELVNAGVER